MPVGPIQSQVYVDQILSNVSIEYFNEDYVADTMFPMVPVKYRTGIYFVYDKSKFHIVNDLRSPGQQANVVVYGLTKANYGPLHDHMLKQQVEDEVVDQAMAPLDPKIDATNNVTERMLLSKEYDAYTQMTSATNFTGGVNKTTLSGTSQWSDYTNSDPVGDVQTAFNTVKKAIMKRPNTLLLGYEVYAILRNHPQILERIKYSQLGVVTPELLAAVFDIPNVVIANAEYNTANEAQTDSMSYLWGKNAWVLYSKGAPSIRAVTFGYTLQIGARQTLVWRDPNPDAFSDWVGVRQYYQQLVVASLAAYWIAAATA